MATDRRREIKRRLREIKRDPASAEPGEAQHLTAEYRRLQSAGRDPAADRPAPTLSRSVVAPADPDAEALATWPPELLARRQTASFNRVVDRASPVSDPDNWGVKNDMRRWRGPWS
jgi:hypothetical protein